MRVVVAYAHLYPETRAALEADGIAAEYADTSASPTAYYDLLARLWREGQTFVNVEGDIVVWPGAVARLLECPEEWCAYAYELSTGWGAWLGCVKFTDSLLAAEPGALPAIDHLPPDGTPRRYWGRLDTRLEQVLAAGGHRKHVHWPAVGHLNPSQQFKGAYNCNHGKPIPREVLMSQPWPYTCACPA